MKDYPDLNMFLFEETVIVPNRPLIVVSSFSDALTEKEAVGFIRNIYLHAPTSKKGMYGCPPSLVYGDDFGLVVFYPHEHTLNRVKEYCLVVAKQYCQPGVIVWDETQASLVAPNGAEMILSPFDGTLARFEKWCQHLRPGFRAKGTWNRQASYIRMRHAKLKRKP